MNLNFCYISFYLIFFTQELKIQLQVQQLDILLRLKQYLKGCQLFTYQAIPKNNKKSLIVYLHVDDLIKSQEKKIETLKAHKKGLMQQLFPNVNDIAQYE